mmetsp:Transcript_25052/g.69953  ORF Transcript_25052/g.69953 Transcript_25052/m.69953 type:complete len:239 (-) Transcript_25052:401-1117(-)
MSDGIEDRHKLPVPLPEHLFQKDALHATVPPGRGLESETSVVKQALWIVGAPLLVDGWQLEEVPAEDHLDASPGYLSFSADYSSPLLQLLQEISGHHANLVDNQCFHSAPLLPCIVAVHQVKVRLVTWDLDACKGVQSGAPYVCCSDACGGRDGQLLAVVVLSQLLDDPPQQERLPCASTPCEEHTLAAKHELQHTGLLLAELDSGVTAVAWEEALPVFVFLFIHRVIHILRGVIPSC